MRTIIAGSRSATYNDVEQALNACDFTKSISAVISGTVNGADYFGEQWAIRNSIPIFRFPANWSQYGKSAGGIRNWEMAENADALIAIWDSASKGTKHMITCDKAKNLLIFVFYFKEV